MKTALYRHYNKWGGLLYVGISLDVLARSRQHRNEAPWYRAIATIQIEYYPDRLSASLAEKIAIIAESPLHNLVRPRLPQLQLLEKPKTCEGAEPKQPPSKLQLCKFTLDYAPLSVALDKKYSCKSIGRLVDVHWRQIVHELRNGNLKTTSISPPTPEGYVYYISGQQVLDWLNLLRTNQ